jgi:hypothetical protein
MGIWIDQITLYCDSCESSKVISTNVEKYAVNNVDIPGDWHVGEEDHTLCPKCVEESRVDMLIEQHMEEDRRKAIGAWEGTLGASGLETLE